MSAGRFILREAGYEFRAASRGPLVPLVFFGLVGYVAILVQNAEYMQQMGAADVARNSPSVIYLMAAGQGFWLFFAWAWIFARVVTRDRDARLHEVILAAPIRLSHLIAARYLGAFGVAALLGLSSPLGFLVVHPLEFMGALPPNSTISPPWIAMFWGWLVFAVPAAAGTGALYVLAALRTQSAAGPFAVSALLMAIWMFSMIVLRGGDIDPALATLIDPTGFGEAEEQTMAWTPAEKMSKLIALSPSLFANRFVWSALPCLLLGVVLGRLRREGLVLERADQGARRVEAARVARPTEAPLPGPVTASSWVKATLLEARWHLTRSLGYWGVWLAMGLMCLMSIGGCFVHVVAHVEGPLVPRPELINPILRQLLYIPLALVIAGFIGAMMRRDEEVGFYEMAGASSAPAGVRLVGRSLAAAAFALSLMVAPVTASYVVMGLAAPGAFSWTVPPIYFLGGLGPALLELAAVTIVLHAVIPRAGLAYTASMLVTFIFLVNYELGIVTYPLFKIGMPPDVSMAELVGWAPWLALIATQATFKVGIFLLGVGLAWLAWRRGFVEHWTDRVRIAGGRLRGGAALILASAMVVLVGTWNLSHRRLVVQGDYEGPEAERATRAAWERRWGPEAASFTLEGGTVVVSVDPQKGRARVLWTLRGVRAKPATLHGELPGGVEVLGAAVDGAGTPVETEHETFALSLGRCAHQGCEVELELEAVRQGWPVDAKTPWLHRSQLWMTAADILPRLGLDPHRALRAPHVRAAHQLNLEQAHLPSPALVAAAGVAPSGDWSWQVELPQAGWHLPDEGRIDGPLDFAVAWRPASPRRTERDGVRAWHGPSRTETAPQVLEDVKLMAACVAHRLEGGTADIRDVLQAPRGGEIALHGGVLWIPEDEGWDVGDDGFGRWDRRRSLARALAVDNLARRAAPRRAPGVRWLLDGVAGWLGLSCVREHDGESAWLALLERDADAVVGELGALEAPIRGTALDGAADWITPYAPLATSSWALALGEPEAIRVVESVVAAVRTGASVEDALQRAIGAEMAAQLLGRPLASDVALVVKGTLKSAERGLRWRWNEGGWQKAEPARSALLLPHRPHGTDAPAELMPLPATVDAQEPFTLLDTWPSFERSITDNVWLLSKSPDG